MPWAAALGGLGSAGGLTAGLGGIFSALGAGLGINQNKILPPALQPLQSQLASFYGDIMGNPAAGMTPMLNNGISQINQGYQQMPDLVSRQLAGLGFGKSGKLGTAMYNIGNARLNDVSNFQSQFNQMVLNRQMQAAAGGNNLLQPAYGTNTGGPGAALMNLGSSFAGISNAMLSNPPYRPQNLDLTSGVGPFGDYSQANAQVSLPSVSSTFNPMGGG